MAALKLCFVFLSVFFHAAFLLPHLVNCKHDDEDNLLQGINSFRTSLGIPVLTKHKKAACLADEVAEDLEDQPCTSINIGVKSPPLSNYNRLVKKCDIDINTTRDGVVLPVCVHDLVPTLVLTNYTHSSYAQYLNNSKFAGAGVGSEDDWMVVVLTTNTAAGSFASGAHQSVVSEIGWKRYVVCLLLGSLVYLV
ncbi:hypothetical protein AB3S75_012280 [Citrus x aurantiifolia]